MASNSTTVIAFDLYGTLLSTESIAKELATHFGDEKAQQIATLWRRYQLEYTWRLTTMGIYKPFDAVTHSSLLHALSELSLSLSDPNITALMHAYDSLSTFPDVAPALTALATDASLSAYVFSNGTPAMLHTSVHSSPSLAPHAHVFRALVTVHDIEVFKPHPRVYEHLAKQVGKTTAKEDMATVWLVSGNPFDVVGARAAGMQAAWVDRGDKGWDDRLGVMLGIEGPTVIAKGVDDAVGKIKKWTQEHGGHSSELKRSAAMGPG